MHVLHVVYNLLFLLFFTIPCYEYPTTYCMILLLLMTILVAEWCVIRCCGYLCRWGRLSTPSLFQMLKSP